MRRLNHIASALGLAIAASACVPNAEPPPVAPAPAPTPVPTPAPTPVPQPTGDWRDWPLTPGNWTYQQDSRGSIASYGQAGSAAVFTMRCDRQQRRIYLSRQGAAPRALPMTIRTSSETRQLSASPTRGSSEYMTVMLAANDRILDAMGFSRGRFIVEMAPMRTLVIPSWAEVLRVTEDCR
ncbi:hypothetical protein KY084_09715 [Stakelama sp. CBK3Z-3]|uniref:Lipoprotein n=1 Tax=Stakelama flava TaxID=2860338 RepID=A0ABS6XLQ6_9SPHN|nr:hypothetical protein [Stakelama flava]MBW4331147.1 hypothetical protein [Stakelama flava]